VCKASSAETFLKDIVTGVSGTTPFSITTFRFVASAITWSTSCKGVFRATTSTILVFKGEISSVTGMNSGARISTVLEGSAFTCFVSDGISIAFLTV